MDTPIGERRGPVRPVSAYLGDPGFLLHGFDPEADTATFLPVDETRLRRAAFIDGRTPLAEAAPLTAPGLAAASAAFERGGAAPRYILHGAFCGSTLLARLLDQPGRTLVLREPQVLGELADRKLDPRLDHPRLAALCALATESLFRPRRPGERVVVKPSNWVNNLLPELCDAGASPRAVFIESELDDFLGAVFRGGSDRMKFVAEAAWRLSRPSPADQALLERGVKDARTAGARAAHLAIVLHVLQRRRFALARGRSGWAATTVIRRETLTADPLQTCRAAAAALDLNLSDEALQAAVRTWVGRHAKDDTVAYTAQAEAAADRSVFAQFGDDLRAALDWARRADLELG